MRPTDLRRTRQLLEPSGWLARARAFAGALRGAGHDPGRLLVVGTETDEPWHLTAHLADTARLSGRALLEPVLVRHVVPPGARPHLAIDLSALTAGVPRTTVLVAAPGPSGEGLLERLADARRRGASLFALQGGVDDDLTDLAHESLAGPSEPVGFDTVSHLVTEAAGADELRRARSGWFRRG